SPADQNVRSTATLAQDIRYSNQYMVACFVTVQIVDGLEVIEVDDEHHGWRSRRARLRRGGCHARDSLVQVAPVAETCERVRHRRLTQALVRVLQVVI